MSNHRDIASFTKYPLTRTWDSNTPSPCRTYQRLGRIKQISSSSSILLYEKFSLKSHACQDSKTEGRLLGIGGTVLFAFPWPCSQA